MYYIFKTYLCQISLETFDVHWLNMTADPVREAGKLIEEFLRK